MAETSPATGAPAGATSVLKLGGSLLEPPDLADLPARLAACLDRHGGARPVVIVGGGATVDIIRRWDRLFGLDEEFAHWLSVRALSTNARLVARILPRAEHVEDVGALAGVWRRGRVPVLDVLRFLVDVDEAGPDPLPRRWSVTSDSIAARVARRLGARRLVLLKSAPPPPRVDAAQAAALGFVDAHFAAAAHGIDEVLVVALREAGLDASVIPPPGESTAAT